MVIVITGTPGVGKHTITRMLADALGLPVLDLNQMAKRAGLIEQGRTEGQVSVSGLRKVLKGALKEACIVVGHLAPYVLSSDQVSRVIVLRRDPYELLATYEGRGYSSIKGIENSGSEILGVIFHDAKSMFGSKTFQIKVAEKHITLKRVLNVIEGGQGDKVDWLELVVRNDDLRKFFAY